MTEQSADREILRQLNAQLAPLKKFEIAEMLGLHPRQYRRYLSDSKQSKRVPKHIIGQMKVLVAEHHKKYSEKLSAGATEKA
jgi:hypothetical protein